GAVGAHGPGWAMTDHRVLLIAGDVRIGHALEVIVRRVVLAHMVEAEAEVLALAQATHGRAMLARMIAAREITPDLRGLRPRFGPGPRSDTVENGRIQIHVRDIMELREAPQGNRLKNV